MPRAGFLSALSNEISTQFKLEENAKAHETQPANSSQIFFKNFPNQSNGTKHMKTRKEMPQTSSHAKKHISWCESSHYHKQFDLPARSQRHQKLNQILTVVCVSRISVDSSELYSQKQKNR